MTPGTIKDAASWYLWLHHSNTSVWHTCLALTYYGLGYRWSTIRACEQALTLDNRAWHAVYLLSMSHMDLFHDEIALSYAEKCLDCWPSDLVWTKLHYRFLRHLAECKYATDDSPGAHSVMANLLRERSADLRAFQAYISFIDDKEMWNDCDLGLIGQAINALHQSESAKFECSLMSEMLLDDLVCDGSLQTIIIRSLRAANKLALGQEILVKAIEAAEKFQKPQYVAALKIDLADVLYENKRSITHAIRCIQQIINANPSSEDDSHDLSLSQQQVRYRGIASLTRYISARLLKSIDDGDRHAQMAAYDRLKQLWNVAKHVNFYIPIWLWFQRHCWYHCFLGASKMHDTQYFEGFWSAGLESIFAMLSRPGSSSVHEEGLPFRRLAYMSQIRGRTDDVLAALSVRNLLNSTAASLKGVGEDLSFYDLICDGPCTDKNTPWRTGQGLHRCQLCLDTHWCEDCMVRLKRVEIAYTLCSAAHSFLQLTPFQKLEEGFVVRGNRTVKITDWLGELAEESGLSQSWARVQSRVESRAVVGTVKHSDSVIQDDSEEWESDHDDESEDDIGSENSGTSGSVE